MTKWKDDLILQSRRTLKKAIHKTLSREFILNRCRRRNSLNKIVVLTYHEIANDDDEIEAWTVVKKTSFIRQMEYLSSYFEVISLEEAIFRMENSKQIIRPTAVVTFDDGYRGNRRILLPVIKSMNIPVTIFISTRAVQDQCLYWYDRLISAIQGKRVININLKHHLLGNYRINRYKGAENWREIERLLRELKGLDPPFRENVVNELIENLNISEKEHSYNIAPLSIAELGELASSPLITIGAHSHCHNILTQLSNNDAKESIEISKELLESWINCRVDYFSYPNGNYNDSIIGTLKEIGFKCGMTIAGGLWGRDDPLFEIPRIRIGRYDSLDFFKINVSGVFN